MTSQLTGAAMTERVTREHVEGWRNMFNRCNDGPDFCLHCRQAVLIDAYLALLDAHETLTTWQPIETAPKDWVPVVVFDNAVEIMYWHTSIGGWVSDSPEVRYPTHWMPLPAPPQKG